MPRQVISNESKGMNKKKNIHSVLGIVSLSVFFYYGPIEVGIQVSLYGSFLTVVTAPLLCIQVSISISLKYSARFGRRESDGKLPTSFCLNDG